ncbi:MAG: hypothetical protein HOY71_39455 [Nonomuraea sp.]|nr:hypothetical protein [Nonomuraea sp.]
MLPWLRIITWTLTVGLVTAVTVWQLKPASATPTAYEACTIPAACAEPHAAFNACRSAHRYQGFGEFNCARVADLYRMCDQRKGASDDATCKAFPYDYLHCVHVGHGALACYVIENWFIDCLDGGRSVPDCTATRRRSIDCLSPGSPKACGPVVDAVFAAPTPSPWRT